MKPEKHTEERTGTHACDCISRQAAIDALYDWSEHSMTDAEAWHIRQVIGDIKSLPPAEPNCSEIPNNSDCISRQAAITAIQKAYADTEGGTDKCAVWKNVGLTNALHIMQDLPSAQPEQHWIPCSERLPEESGLYIVTNVGRWVEPVGTRYYNIRANGGFWSGHPGNKVLAWMPLPEKYGGEQDG